MIALNSSAHYLHAFHLKSLNSSLTQLKIDIMKGYALETLGIIIILFFLDIIFLWIKVKENQRNFCSGSLHCWSMCSIEANICKAIQLAIDNSEMASKTFLLHIAHYFFEINDHSKTTVKIFSNMQLTYFFL